MKYTKIVSSLMISTMALNLIQQGVTIYAEEQTPATTVISEEAKKELKGNSILDSLGETGISSEKEVPNTEESNEQPTLSTEASSEPSMKETTPSISKEEAKDSSDKTEKIQVKADASDVTEGDWSAQWDEQLGRYKLTNYTGDKTNVQVPTTFKNKPVAISLVEMSNTLNLKGLTSFSANGTNKEIKVLDTSFSDLFSNNAKVTTIDMRGFDTANVTNMAWMFRHCSNLTNVDVSNLDTSNVTTINCMFEEVKFSNSDFSKWDVSKVTDMGGLFYNCSSLTKLDVSNWDTSNVTLGVNMFYGVKNCVIDGDKNEFTRLSDIGLDASNIWLEDVVNTVNTLFKDDTHTVLNDGITQNKISVARNTVDKLPDSLTEKKELSELVAKAQKLFNEKEHLETEGDWAAQWDEQLGRYKLMDYTGDKTNVQVPTTFKNKPVAISLVEMSDILNLKDLTSFSATGTNKEIKVLDTDWSNLFKMSTATTIDMRGFDVSNVLNMTKLFNLATDLTTLYVDNWDTSNVTTMYGLFSNCRKLSKLDVSNWNTSNVTDMSYTFQACNELTALDVSNWDTSNVTSFLQTFRASGKLSSLDLSRWNISNANSIFYMFGECTGLRSLDLSNWDVSKLVDLKSLFYGCSNLEEVNLEGWDLSNVMNIRSMFDGCNKLTSLNLKKWKLPNSLRGLFSNFKGLKHIDLTGWDLSKTTDLSDMFRNCDIETLDLSNWDVSSVTNISNMFNGCSNLTTLNLSGWDASYVTNMDSMFANCSNLTNLDVSNWKLPTSLAGMFKNYTGTTAPDLSTWDVSHVTNMSHMFNGCKNMTEVNVKDWDVSHVTNMESMFQDCTNLTTLDVSKWDTSRVTDMNGLFFRCPKLSTLDVSNWNTSSLVIMSNMFNGCKGLTDLDLSKWNTSRLEKVDSTFANCSALKLNLRNWILSKVNFATNMFYGSWNSIIYGDKEKITSLGKISLDEKTNLWPDDIAKQVNALFRDSAHTGLNTGVTQTTIDTAKSSVEALPDTETNKQTLVDLVTQAQTLLDQKAGNDEITKVDSYVVGTDELVKGTYTADKAAYIGVEINGVKQAIVSLEGLTSGEFRYYIGKQIKTTDKVYVVLYDENKNEITCQSVTIEKAGTDEITKVNAYAPGPNGLVTGTVKYNSAALVGLEVNGQSKGIVPCDTLKNGTFQYYPGNNGLSATDKVEVVLYTANYSEITRAAVPIKQAEDQITNVTPYIAGPNGMVTGTVSYDQAALIDLEVNGQSLGLMASDTLKNGTFQYYPGNNGLSATDKVEVVLYTVGGVEITREVVPVQTAKDKIVRVNPFVSGIDEKVTGTLIYSSAALVGLEVNGQSKGIVPCDTLKNGTFQYYAGKGLKPTDKVEVVLYTAGYTEITRQAVSFKKAAKDEITHVNPYIEGTDEKITGTLNYDKAALIGVEVDGKMQVIVPSEELKNGTFQYYIGTGLKSTSKVYVVLYSPTYVEITRAAVPINTK